MKRGWNIYKAGPGHDCYAYRAALYCIDCGAEIIEALDAEGIEDTGDTDDFPQPGFFSESDCPEHCHNCGELLPVGLTSDGLDYVRDEAQLYIDHGDGSAEVIAEWLERWGDCLDWQLDAREVFDTVRALREQLNRALPAKA